MIKLVEAIKKMTSMAADRIGHFDVANKVGTYADLVVFDFENIQDNAAIQTPTDIQLVLITS